MREMLFRGFHPCEDGTEKVFINGEWIKGKWVYGYYYKTHTGEHEISHYNSEFNIERYTYEVIPETVGQFTGLTDKNGTKIFEGDIIDFTPTTHKVRGVVEYDEGGFVANNYFLQAALYQHTDFDGEVVGNIHDNPEMLRGDNNEQV